MPISLRLRGAVYHARGSIRVGTRTVTVAEFSTGARTRADAEAAVAAESQRIRAEILDGPAGRTRHLTVADAFEGYLCRPGGVRSHDQGRIGALNAAMGASLLTEAPAAWNAWIKQHAGKAPATLQRERTILMAALNHTCAAEGVPVPVLTSIKQSREEKVVYLTPMERAALLRSYNPHAACPALMLCYQGMRTQEVLQLDWRDVDLVRETLHVRSGASKSGRGRTISTHPKVQMLLVGLWHSSSKPDRGAVFRSSRGDPYTDTRGRDGGQQGGNPLSQAHATACTRAGVVGFRVHDWRHDWAARLVMQGVDLYTIMRAGGWSSLRMVERYASITAEHSRDAIRKLA